MRGCSLRIAVKPLLAAALAGLLCCAFPVDAQNLSSREKSFFRALDKKDARAALRILRGGPLDANLRDTTGRTALMQASLAGLEEVVADLLERGADVNVKSKEEQTALMLASDVGDVEIVKMLLARDANPRVEDRDKWTALQYAQQRILSAEGERKKAYEEIIEILQKVTPPEDK